MRFTGVYLSVFFSIMLQILVMKTLCTMGLVREYKERTGMGLWDNLVLFGLVDITTYLIFDDLGP